MALAGSGSRKRKAGRKAAHRPAAQNRYGTYSSKAEAVSELRHVIRGVKKALSSNHCTVARSIHARGAEAVRQLRGTSSGASAKRLLDATTDKLNKKCGIGTRGVLQETFTRDGGYRIF